MPKKPMGSNDLAKFTDGDAIIQYKNLGKGVKGNANFLHPDVDCGEYDAAGLEYEANVADKPKTPEKTATKNISRKVINKNYKTQVNYVNRISDGDLVMLNSANVVLNHEDTPHEDPAFSVKLGKKSGCLLFKSKKDKKAKVYLVEMRMITGGTTTEWAYYKAFGVCELEVAGFVSGQVYEFRMKIVYSKTESGYFNTVQIRAN